MLCERNSGGRDRGRPNGRRDGWRVKSCRPHVSAGTIDAIALMGGLIRLGEPEGRRWIILATIIIILPEQERTYERTERRGKEANDSKYNNPL